MHPEA